MRARSGFHRFVFQTIEAVGFEPQAVFEPRGRCETGAALWRLPRGAYDLPADTHVQLFCLLDGEPPELMSCAAGYDPDHALALVPPGVTMKVRCDGTAFVLQVLLSPRALAASGRRVDFLQERNLGSRRLMCLRDPFAVAFLSGTLFHNRTLFESCDAFRDSFTDLLSIHLLNHHGSDQVRREPVSDVLATEVLERLDSFVDANMERKIATEDLASLSGLSMFHFSRKFKLTTGLSPYEYVLVRRVQKARALLINTDRSIAEVALDVGFSSQSHFTTVFKQVLGQTPGRFREGASRQAKKRQQFFN